MTTYRELAEVSNGISRDRIRGTFVHIMLTVGLNSCPNSQSFLIQLPPEIISQIVDYCPSSNILALSNVCKSMQEVGVRSLYRHLSFTEASRFLKCCYALIRNNGAASSVRGLQINLVEWVTIIYFHQAPFSDSLGQSRHILFAFFQILATVLRRLHNLQCLEVLHDGPGFQWALESCYFPHLSLLRTRLPLTQDLINFLSRHSSTISELHLDGQSSIFTLSPVPITLPNLTSFTGNPGFVRFIVQRQDKPQLSSAHMTSLNIMDLEEVEIIEAMKHLQDVAGETLRTVTIVGSGFAGPLARHASNYLTNLKVLGLMHLSFMEIVSNGILDFSEHIFMVCLCKRNCSQQSNFVKKSNCFCQTSRNFNGLLWVVCILCQRKRKH